MPALGERRKGPAPPPPVTGSSANTPTSSASSTPSKKGPAPAVPASTTPSKPRAPSPIDTSSNAEVGESVVTTPPPATSDINKQMTSTPSGKSPAPIPVTIVESPVPTKESLLVSEPDTSVKENNSSVLSEENENIESSNISNISAKSKDTHMMDYDEAADKTPDKESDGNDSTRPLYIDEEQLSERMEDVTDTNNEKTEIAVSEENLESDMEMPSALKSKELDQSSLSTEIKINPVHESEKDIGAPCVNTHESSLQPQASDLLSSVPSSPSVISTDQNSNEQSSQEVPVMPPSAFLTPTSPEAVIASIGSDATVIVRTPTPTPQEPAQPVKKDSVVTYSGELELFFLPKLHASVVDLHEYTPYQCFVF